MHLTAESWVGICFTLMIFFVALGSLFKLALRDKRDIPRLVGESGEKEADELIKNHPGYNFMHTKVIRDIYDELPHFFSRNTSDHDVAFESICHRLADFEMTGPEFSDLHSEIRKVLLENGLDEMAEKFDQLCAFTAQKG